MTQSMTRLGRATRTFAAALAIVGVTAVMVGAKTARAWDQQASDDTLDDAVNRQAATQGYALAPRPDPYASVRRDRRIAAPPAARNDSPDTN